MPISLGGQYIFPKHPEKLLGFLRIQRITKSLYPRGSICPDLSHISRKRLATSPFKKQQNALQKVLHQCRAFFVWKSYFFVIYYSKNHSSRNPRFLLRFYYFWRHQFATFCPILISMLYSRETNPLWYTRQIGAYRDDDISSLLRFYYVSVGENFGIPCHVFWQFTAVYPLQHST